MRFSSCPGVITRVCFEESLCPVWPDYSVFEKSPMRETGAMSIGANSLRWYLNILEDPVTKVELRLLYGVLEKEDIITRSEMPSRSSPRIGPVSRKPESR